MLPIVLAGEAAAHLPMAMLLALLLAGLFVIHLIFRLIGGAFRHPILGLIGIALIAGGGWVVLSGGLFAIFGAAFILFFVVIYGVMSFFNN